jgi:hypothetical protein
VEVSRAALELKRMTETGFWNNIRSAGELEQASTDKWQSIQIDSQSISADVLKLTKRSNIQMVKSLFIINQR